MSEEPLRWWNDRRKLPGFARMGRRGNVAVEFALLAPLVLLLLAGIVDYGLAINSRMSLSSAVRAGLQYAMHHSANAELVEQSVLGALSGNVEGAGVTASRICECPNGDPADCEEACSDGRNRVFVQIEAQRPYATLMSWPGIESPAVLNVVARVRIQ